MCNVPGSFPNATIVRFPSGNPYFAQDLSDEKYAPPTGANFCTYTGTIYRLDAIKNLHKATRRMREADKLHIFIPPKQLTAKDVSFPTALLPLGDEEEPINSPEDCLSLPSSVPLVLGSPSLPFPLPLPLGSRLNTCAVPFADVNASHRGWSPRLKAKSYILVGSDPRRSSRSFEPSLVLYTRTSVPFSASQVQQHGRRIAQAGCQWACKCHARLGPSRAEHGW
jgi:hypothetical protein